MKGSKILICGGVLIIMHYIDFMLFDRVSPPLSSLTPPQELSAAGYAVKRNLGVRL